MKPQIANKSFRVALGSFVVTGMLAVMLVASLSTSWGVAYGQSAGPTPTTAVSTKAPSATSPSAVDNSNTSPTTAAAVGDANQAPVGVVPGLPHTGTGSQVPASDDTWKYGVLGLLALNMIVAAVVMRRSGKSSK